METHHHTPPPVPPLTWCYIVASRQALTNLLRLANTKTFFASANIKRRLFKFSGRATTRHIQVTSKTRIEFFNDTATKKLQRVESKMLRQLFLICFVGAFCLQHNYTIIQLLPSLYLNLSFI
jgi:hypothetical protein